MYEKVRRKIHVKFHNSNLCHSRYGIYLKESLRQFHLYPKGTQGKSPGLRALRAMPIEPFVVFLYVFDFQKGPPNSVNSVCPWVPSWLKTAQVSCDFIFNVKNAYLGEKQINVKLKNILVFLHNIILFI